MNEQLLSLGQVFVDSTKAFDTVNRDALWKLLVKFGCTPVFVDKLRQLHPSMKAPVNYNGQLSGATEVENGDILAPTSFSSTWQRFFGIFFPTAISESTYASEPVGKYPISEGFRLVLW